MHPTGFLVLANTRLSDLMLEADAFRLANAVAAQDLPSRSGRDPVRRGSAGRWTRRLRELLAPGRAVTA